MLTTKERDLVTRWLEQHLIENAPILPYVRALLAPDGEQIVVNLPSHDTAHAHSIAVLAACERDGWTLAPPLIVRLLEPLKLYVGIAPIVDRLTEGPEPPGSQSPYDAFFLTGRRVFLGRRETRKLLRRLKDDGGPYVALVNGPKLCGKSYTAYLATHLAEHYGDFRTSLVELLPNTSVSFKPEDLAASLVRGMGRRGDLPANLNPSPERRVQELGEWVISEAAQSGSNWWFIIDGFDDPDLNEYTRSLIERLCDSISKSWLATRIRILLLDYVKPLPVSVKPTVDEDAIAGVNHISDIEVREYYTWLFNRVGTSEDQLLPTVDGAVRTTLETAKKACAASGDDWLVQVGAAVQEVTRAVLR